MERRQSVFFLVAILMCILYFVSCSEAAKWEKADLTTYESYPTTREECEDYKGCDYQGQFAFLSGKKSKSWVKSHHIISIHNKFSSKYKLKTFRIRQGTKEITATVYDECNDKDCNNCCTKNSKKTGFLIDMESFTANKFGASHGVVQWICIDC